MNAEHTGKLSELKHQIQANWVYFQKCLVKKSVSKTFNKKCFIFSANLRMVPEIVTTVPEPDTAIDTTSNLCHCQSQENNVLHAI